MRDGSARPPRPQSGEACVLAPERASGRPTWEDLIEREEGRRYDPADPDTGMTCSYCLFGQGSLEGVGGVMWTHSVTIWATAPPRYGTTPPTNLPG